MVSNNALKSRPESVSMSSGWLARTHSSPMPALSPQLGPAVGSLGLHGELGNSENRAVAGSHLLADTASSLPSCGVDGNRAANATRDIRHLRPLTPMPQRSRLVRDF